MQHTTTSILLSSLFIACTALLLKQWLSPTSTTNSCKGNPSVSYNASLALEQATALASYSWEMGTAAEALLELYDGELSVFGRRASPFAHPASSPPPDLEHAKSLLYAKSRINTHADSHELQDGHGAAADPASLGVSAALLGRADPQFADAVRRQVEYLLTAVPRFRNGAISHRAAYAELWADSVYMVPPLLAYQGGVVENDAGLVREAVEQIGLYRAVLLANATAASGCGGPWMHIVGPEREDRGLWSTGNGWVAGGMARVLAVVQGCAARDGALHGLEERLVRYAKELLDGVICVDSRTRTDSGLLRNYLDDGSWFPEAAGTAMLAAAAYRVRSLRPDVFGAEYARWAGEKHRAVAAHIDHRTGVVAPVVYPLDHLDRRPLYSGSSEAQSFVALMYAAYRDCVCEGLCPAV